MSKRSKLKKRAARRIHGAVARKAAQGTVYYELKNG